MIQFKQYLTEIKQNELYKEFRKSQKNPQQMELAFDFDDEIFTSNQEIARHILRQLNFISIGFEFEMYLKLKHSEKLIEAINLYDIKEDILNFVENFFILDNYKLYNLNEQYDKFKQKNQKYKLALDEYIDIDYESAFEFVKKFRLKIKNDYTLENEYIFSNYESLLESEYSTLSDILQKNLKIKIKNNMKNKKNYSSYWYIENDHSLNDISFLNNKKYFPIEIITKTYPAYKYKEVFNSLIKTLKDNDYNPISNNLTGLHFSISFDNKELNSNINLLKLIILGQDSFFLKKLGREFNEYCQSQYKLIVDKIEELSSDDLLTKDIITQNNFLIKQLNNSILNREKYTSINLSKYQIKSKNKFIEFRITGNDYLKEFKELSLRTIDWFLFIIIAASSKTLLEDEFYKKIEEISRKFVEKKG